MSYRVTVELDAPTMTFDVPRVAAAVCLALGHADTTRDLVITRLDVEREDA